MTYQQPGIQPIIWLSPAAKLAPGKSIRGGVPICWPWFGPHASESGFPAHGFARTVPWQVVASEAVADGSTRMIFELPQSSIPAAQWPHACRVRYIVTVGRELNSGTGHREYRQCRIRDRRGAAHLFSRQRRGCSSHQWPGWRYLSGQGGQYAAQGPVGADRDQSEVDRLYVDTETECLIEDAGCTRRIRISKRGSRSTVVWNPWVEKSAKMGDFGSDTGYRGMVCVESANAAENTVNIAPGASHVLAVIYHAEKT